MCRFFVMYNARWQKARATYLSRNPECVMCLQVGRHEQATVVDHITPHRGNSELFWDSDNWQALCKHCHDSHKQRIEHGKQAPGVNAQGLPLDSKHHWNV